MTTKIALLSALLILTGCGLGPPTSGAPSSAPDLAAPDLAPPPLTDPDVCLNLPGSQAELPPGYVLTDAGRGECFFGCKIDGDFIPAEAWSTDPLVGVCRTCKNSLSTSKWQLAQPGTTCGTNRTCDATGACVGQPLEVFRPTGPIKSLWAGGSVAWAIGPNMTAYRSADSGKSWSTISLGANLVRTAVWGPDASSVFIASASGVVIKSTTGDFWNSYATGTTQTLRGVGGTAADNVYAVGANGTILRSVNAGASWNTQSLGVPNVLYGVAGTSPNNVVAVGDGGTIVRSNNSSTWTAVASGTTAPLYMVRALSFGFVAVGWDGTVVLSSDGVTWRLGAPIVDETCTDVAEVASVLYAACGEGLFASSDRAQSWHKQQLPADVSVAALAVSGPRLVAGGSVGGVGWIGAL